MSDISIELKQVLRRLKLSPMAQTLPERIELARQKQIPFQDFLLLVLSDEAQRRDGNAVALRSTRAKLEPQMRLESWDNSAHVTFDRQLWNELSTLRFVRSCHNVLILGPVGVGKTFLATALGHIACRQGRSTLMMRADKLFKQLKASRLDNSYDRELRRVIGVDLLILDDFGLDQMDSQESHDFYDIVVERHRHGSIVLTSNREPVEWLALMADPIRAQSAIDRLQNSAYELVVEGESYRTRQKPTLQRVAKET
jgi:DNA replication protein DnaC